MATVTSAARESGYDNILYSMSDGSTILLDGHNAAAVDNNPGDLTGNYSSLGNYNDFSIYTNRSTGVQDLENYLSASIDGTVVTPHDDYVSLALSTNPNLTIGDISGSPLYGGWVRENDGPNGSITINGTVYAWSQVYDPAGHSPDPSVTYSGYDNPDTSSGPLDGDYNGIAQFITTVADPADLLYTSVVSTPALFTLWVESIIQFEGGNNSTSIDVTLPSSSLQSHRGISTGAEISLAVAYDVNFSDILGGTEIDLGNDLATKIVDGSIWYTENTANDTETFSSDISESYSSSNDTLIAEPWRPSSDTPTTPPVFTLGTLDTATFYELGDGTTIYAGGTAGGPSYELTIESDGVIASKYAYRSGYSSFALPAGFVANPTDGIVTSLQSGYADLEIYNSINSIIPVTLAGQVVVAAAIGADFKAGNASATLIDVADNLANPGTLDLSGTGINFNPPDVIYTNEAYNSYGSPEQLITINSNTLTVSGNLTIAGGNGLHILNLSPEDPGNIGTSYLLSAIPSGAQGFYLESGNTLTFDAVNFNDIVLGAGNDILSSSVSNVTIAPGSQFGAINGSSDLTDILDLSGNIDSSTNAFGSVVELSGLQATAYGNENYALTSPSDPNGLGSSLQIDNIKTIVGGGALTTFVLPNAGTVGQAGDFFEIVNGSNVTYFANGSGAGDGISIASVGGVTTIISKMPLTGDGGASSLAAAANWGSLASGTSSPETLVLVGFTTIETENAYAASQALGNTIGGGQTVSIGSGSVSNNDVVDANGVEVLLPGGTANFASVNSGGTLIDNGGLANNPRILPGGAAYSHAHDAIDNAVDYGSLYVSSGGVVNSAIVNSGGVEYVYSGGITSGDILNSGGKLDVYSGGVASGIAVYRGGADYILGGTVVSAGVSSAGVEYISSGGVAKNTKLERGVGLCG